MAATLQERARLSATDIIRWTLDDNYRIEVDDDNFVTSEIVRVVESQRKIDIDLICDLMITAVNEGLIETADVGKLNMWLRKNLE